MVEACSLAKGAAMAYDSTLPTSNWAPRRKLHGDQAESIVLVGRCLPAGGQARELPKIKVIHPQANTAGLHLTSSSKIPGQSLT